MLVEYARNVLGAEGAEHAETSPDAADLVVTPLSCSLWGQEHPVVLVPGTRTAGLYGVESAAEDYFCSSSAGGTASVEIHSASAPAWSRLASSIVCVSFAGL